MQKAKKLYFLILSIAFYLLTFTGCATIPSREAFPTYEIKGITYLPLISFCSLKGISWEYDTFTRVINLSKDEHKINLRVGDELILVDGNPVHLKHPVDLYQGTVVVPYRFKEEILDFLSREVCPVPKAMPPLSKIKAVVIDAGHGGNDPGAIGKTGLAEKNVNLDTAKRLAGILKAQGLKVIMTRSRDIFIPLPARVEIANKSHADIFLSIHSNANRVRSLSGFEVYYIASNVDDAKRASWAAQNVVLDLDKSFFASDSLDLKAILWDMIYTASRAESIKLASSICRTIDRNLETRILGVKSARFYVLKGAVMPAVLIETGFLSNYNEERKLKNGYYRQKIAESIAQGLGSYAQNFGLTKAAKQ